MKIDIVNCNVVTGDGETFLEDSTVVIENGFITDLHQMRYIPYQFYIALGIYALQIDAELARPWMEYGIEKSPPEEYAYLMLGQTLALSPLQDLAEEYLKMFLGLKLRMGRR